MIIFLEKNNQKPVIFLNKRYMSKKDCEAVVFQGATRLIRIPQNQAA